MLFYYLVMSTSLGLVAPNYVIAQNIPDSSVNSKNNWLTDSLVEITRDFMLPNTKQEFDSSILYFTELATMITSPDVTVTTGRDSLMLRKLMLYTAYFTRVKRLRVKRSMKYYLRAHDLVSDKVYLDKMAHTVELTIANNYDRLGDYERAISFYKRCIPHFEKYKSKGQLARLYKDLGNSYGFFGDSLRRRDNLLKSYELSFETNDHDAQCASIAALAYYSIEIDTSQFMKFYSEGIELLKRLDSNHRNNIRKAHLYNLLSKYYFNKDKVLDAIEALRKAIQLNADTGNENRSRGQAKNFLTLANYYLDLNHYDDALATLDSSFLILTGNHLDFASFGQKNNNIIAENTLMDIYLLLATIQSNFYLVDHKLGHLVDALNSIDLGLQIDQLIEADLSMPRSQLIASSSMRLLTEKGVECAFLLWSATKDATYIDKADGYIAASKNRILERNMRNRLIEANLSHVDEAKMIIWRKELALNNQDPSHVLRIQDSLSDLRDKYELGRSIPKNSTGVIWEYFITSSEIYLLENNNGRHIYKLGLVDDFKVIFNKFNACLANQCTIEIKELLSQLTEFLLPSELSVPKHLIIIPDGLLANFSFDILKLNDKYLSDRATIRYQYSRVDMSRPAKDKMKLMGIAPNYKLAGFSDIAVERGEMGYLPNAANELLSIKEILIDDVFMSDHLDIEMLTEVYQGYNILHFAGHAVVEKEDAYLAFINSKNNISPLRPIDIYNGPFNFDLVTLSACETGLGAFQHGEGVTSLGSSFLHSGSSAIVYSLWKSNDYSTRQIMTAFYRYLKTGKAKDAALRQAKLDYLRMASPEMKHPYYWAGFVFVGNSNAFLTQSTWVDYIQNIMLFLFIIHVTIKLMKK